MARFLDFFTRAFPLWVSLCSLLALLHPPLFTWFIERDFVTPGLQVIMLAMGLTLEVDDLRAVAQKKRLVLLGVVLQYTIMPGVGYLVSRLLALPDPLAAGLILVCCCPGGTASNVITYLAKADVALSVAMTACSTLLAALMTPTLSALLIGKSVEVDVRELYFSTAEVVLFPVVLGVALRRYAGQVLAPALPALPALAVVAIVLIVAGIIGVQKKMIMESGALALSAVILAHGLSFFIAFVAGRLAGASVTASRTISIEVGMQNSGLGVVLARASFADPLVAVTPALSAVVHCLYGSGLAAYFRSKPVEDGTLPE